MKPKPNVNVSALAAGVTSLFGVIGALTATGVVGRLERNEPETLIAAVLIVLLGAARLVIAGLPITTDRSEIFATLVGTGLTIIGIGWAVVAGIKDAGQSERPELQVAIRSEPSTLKGTVKAGNLASDRRLAVLVEGLTASKHEDRNWDVTTLAQYYVGPDGDGKVDMPLEVLLPATSHSHVGVRAWSRETKSCPTYPRRGGGEEFSQQVEEAGAGCVVLPLPEAESTAPTPPEAPAEPTVELQWIGNRVRATRARLRVTATGAGKRVAVLVAGRRGGATRQLLRTVNRIGEAGAYRATVAIRVGRAFTRLCARADLLDAGERAPVRIRRCPLPKSPRIGEAGSELSRPR